MSARNTIFHLLTRAGIAFAALFLVSVLLAAMPGHHAPAAGAVEQENSAAPAASQAFEHSNMPGMDIPGDEKSSEHAAVDAMNRGHDAHSQHMYMTSMRPRTPDDVQRATEIVTQLRGAIEKYRDYHVAIDEGFKIFLPNVPQPEYHFTSYKNGFLEAFTFDPARPTSLLYKKTATGYELAVAMYTMPKRATEEQLNARVPLSVAMWHLHTNLCMPDKARGVSFDQTKFGLRGSIASQEACDAADGKFHPVIFGWMVHVYPYEDSLDKIFAMHHHMD